MRATAVCLYLAATMASVQASFTARSAHPDESEDMVVTWTKPGRLFRAREVTVPPQTVVVTEVSTVIPTATFALRSVKPTSRNTKRAFLNGWSFQGCANDDNGLPSLVSPFSYQLDAEDVSGASCMDFCDERGNSLAALQNGNECWCGEPAGSLNHVEKSACNVPCAGELGEMCGGKDKLSIYSKAA